MYQSLVRNEKGIVENRPSAYKPSELAKKRIQQAAGYIQDGHRNLTKVYRELNDRSVIEYLYDCRQAFNSYVPPRSSDPDVSWRAQTVRPITRNRLISIAAHITANLIYPTPFAQNDQDQEDRGAALVMKDLIEWTIENSQYEREYLHAIIGALVSPAVVMETGFAKHMRTIRELHDNGEITTKEVVDEVLSGFYTSSVAIDEILISNPWEKDIQKQDFVARRQYITYTQASNIAGEHPDFKHVQPGVNVLYAPAEDAFFMDMDGETESYQVERIRLYIRKLDLELEFMNGVLVSDPNQPMRRLDKKYPFAKSGFEPIDEGRFFYYKSAADKIGQDQELVNTLYNMVIDGSFMSLMPPTVLYGSEEVDSSIMIPGSINMFNEDTKIDTLNVRSDLRGGLQAIDMVERNINESTQDPQRSGIHGGGEMTASQAMTLEKNAQIGLDLFGKMIEYLVEDLGSLMVSDIMQHYTVAESIEALSEGGRIKYRNFLLPQNSAKGRKKSKEIKFTDEFDVPDEDVDEETLKDMSFDVLEEEGGLDSNCLLYTSPSPRD